MRRGFPCPEAVVSDLDDALRQLDEAVRALEQAAPGGGGAEAGADELQALKKRIRKLRAERQEHHDALERMKADRARDAEMIEDALEELRALV